MSEPSMVCNGHKENNVEKCSVNAVSELLSVLEKPNADSIKIAENTTNKTDSMTIGTIPFPDFDHLYASSVKETTNTNTMNLNIARSNLNSYHLNIIEEQAKIIDAQSLEISKLKKQNEALIARIERMNRRLSLNQCSRKSSSRRMSHPYRQSASDSEPLENAESAMNYVDTENIKDEQLDDSFPDDIPLIKLTPFGKQNDSSDTKSINEESLMDGLEEPIHKQEENEPLMDEKTESMVHIPNKENSKSNFRIKFRRNNISISTDRRKRNKMVRFAEENKSLQNLEIKSPKRNCAKTVDEQQLISDDAVLFLKTYPEQETTSKPAENESEEAQSAQTIKKKKSLKIPILVTSEPYFANEREDICQDPVTYTPTSLEVPSFRTIEKDNIESPDVPKNYYEDVRIEAAKERHLRFEVGERKRKKWDVQRIRELRQNERLKEKLRRRKSRWSKLDSPKQVKPQIPEKVTALFPEIKTIEKIIITNAVPVTALGTSIPKVPSWGVEFETEWLNDGSIDSIMYEDNQPTNHPHCKDLKTKPA